MHKTCDRETGNDCRLAGIRTRWRIGVKTYTREEAVGRAEDGWTVFLRTTGLIKQLQ